MGKKKSVWKLFHETAYDSGSKAGLGVGLAISFIAGFVCEGCEWLSLFLTRCHN